ncbi:hypothetical protein [Siminovitchia sp. FSL W7-1587]|uniref:hypothetical protein n=1 Tax=Siminovitchia sp. FSL W7-1587 TaxID=2954699 RepID=UPI0030D52166
MDLKSIFTIALGVVILIFSLSVITQLQKDTGEYDKNSTILIFLLVFDTIALPILGYLIAT